MVLLEIILPIGGIVISGISYYVKKKKVKFTCMNRQIDLTDETVKALEVMNEEIKKELEEIKKQNKNDEGRTSINPADHKRLMDMMKIMKDKAID